MTICQDLKEERDLNSGEVFYALFQFYFSPLALDFKYCQGVKFLIGGQGYCRHAHKLAREGNLITEESGFLLRTIDDCVLKVSPLSKIY
jgi:hypothetical protein